VSAQDHTPVRVLVVDDSVVCQHALCAVVTATPGFEAVGVASSGREALDLVPVAEAQLVLLDVHMPGLDGLETARRIRRRHPDVGVVLISASSAASASDGAPAIEDKHDVSPNWLADRWRRLNAS
jgi:two-component system invasion response regulator UvrY